MEQSEKLIDELMNSAEVLKYPNWVDASSAIKRAKGLLGRMLGDSHTILGALDQLNTAFDYSQARKLGLSNIEYARYFDAQKDKLVDIITAAKDEILVSGFKPNPGSPTKGNPMALTKVFIVHGHKEEMKYSVARTIAKLKLEEIILDEQANEGKTIIEKFEEYSDVGYAVILLSADDKGYANSEGAEKIQSRARQNVIFEMGFFIAKLSRRKVMLLLEPGVERPSDIDGLVYTAYDGANGSWRNKLVKELQACGYHVDANNLL